MSLSIVYTHTHTQNIVFPNQTIYVHKNIEKIICHTSHIDYYKHVHMLKYTQSLCKLFVANCDYDDKTMDRYLGKTMGAKDFKHVFKDFYPCKIVKNNHDGPDCTIGLNTPNCSSNKLFFNDIKNVLAHSKHTSQTNYITQTNPSTQIALLEIPDDQEIYIGENTFETNTLFVQNIFTIEEFVHYLEKTNVQQLMAFISNNPREIFKHVQNKTISICKHALKHDVSVLEFIENQSTELCEYAIDKNPDAIKYVRDKTLALSIRAVKISGLALRHIDEQNELIVIHAIRQNGCALRHVKNKTKELCVLAVISQPWALEFVNEQTDDLCAYAVRQNGWTIHFVKNQTEEICKLAIRQNPSALWAVRDKTAELINYSKSIFMDYQERELLH